MARMQSAKPARKLWLTTAIASLVAILLWVIESAAKTKVPSTIAVAITTLVTSIISYFIPPAEADQVIP